MENKVLRYETQIQLVPSSMKQLNNQFALVDILLCYHGNNRNMTSMSKEVIESALPSLYGIPIVGEYIYLDDGSQDFGSHGGKIIISDKGIQFEDTTKPYGFVTKDAVENAKWVTITEKDGFTKHEYLELKGCVIWQKRYEEVSVLLDKNYGQSMEISINKGHYNEDNYFVIEDMTFSAACILGSNPDGTDVEPCFESACIGRHYELDSFKKEFTHMLDEYKKLNLEPNKEEKKFMDLEKLNAFLSTFTIGEGENAIERYCLIGTPGETDFTVIDKEDNFKVYTVGYALDDTGDIVADWDGKVEKKFSVVDADNENSVDLNALVDFNATIEKRAEKKAFSITEELTTAFNAEIEAKNEEYKQLEGKFNEVNGKLTEFENEKAEMLRIEHKTEVDSVVAEFAKKLGRMPKFLVYKAKLNADNVTVDEVKQELTLMLGEAMVGGKSANFSYQPQETKVVNSNSDEMTSRYGHLLDKYRK